MAADERGRASDGLGQWRDAGRSSTTMLVVVAFVAGMGSSAVLDRRELITATNDHAVPVGPSAPPPPAHVPTVVVPATPLAQQQAATPDPSANTSGS